MYRYTTLLTALPTINPTLMSSIAIDPTISTPSDILSPLTSLDYLLPPIHHVPLYDLNSIDDETATHMFRFTVPQIHDIIAAMQLPPYITCDNDHVLSTFDGMYPLASIVVSIAIIRFDYAFWNVTIVAVTCREHNDDDIE